MRVRNPKLLTGRRLRLRSAFVAVTPSLLSLAGIRTSWCSRLAQHPRAVPGGSLATPVVFRIISVQQANPTGLLTPDSCGNVYGHAYADTYSSTTANRCSARLGRTYSERYGITYSASAGTSTGRWCSEVIGVINSKSNRECQDRTDGNVPGCAVADITRCAYVRGKSRKYGPVLGGGNATRYGRACHKTYRYTFAGQFGLRADVITGRNCGRASGRNYGGTQHVSSDSKNAATSSRSVTTKVDAWLCAPHALLRARQQRRVFSVA